jgi:hypothetical protein
MGDSTLLKNSSLFIAYMGCMGWGSAYFYGWGTSFHYGFPWWVVGAGVDDVARSLFYAVTVIVIFLFGWAAGVVFFLSIKQKNSMRDLSIVRLFLAVLLLFVPPALEFSVIHQQLMTDLLILSVIAALIITLIIRWSGHLFSVKCISEMHFVRRHRIEIVMAGFMIYFWVFSLLAGCFKPHFKKEYQMIYHEHTWYYVLARYDNRLVLSESFSTGGKKFIIYNTGQTDDMEIKVVRVR